VFKASKVELYCNILSIEKYLDGCVKILSLGRFFFVFLVFSFFVIMRLLFVGTKSLMQR